MRNSLCIFAALILSGCFPSFGIQGGSTGTAAAKPAEQSERLIASSTEAVRVIAPTAEVQSPTVAQAKAAVAKVAAAITPAKTEPVAAVQAGEPVVTRATATKHNAVVVAEHAYQYGIWCIIIGAVMCGVPALPTGPGYGVVGAGILLLIAGIFLPAYYWWIGWGLLIGCAGWFVEHRTTSDTWAAALAWLKSKLHKQPTT